METHGFLKIIAGGDSQILPLAMLAEKPRLTFGRHHSCDCVLSHPTVSRQHFFLERTAGKVLVVDNSSGNGTFVNSNQIAWVELKDGDKIQAGPFVLIADLSSTSEPPAAEGTPAPDPTLPAVEETSDTADPLREFRGLYPGEYLEGIAHFNAGRYFEAHEVWEDIWLRSSGQEKVFYQMLIQSAVGLHHLGRGNLIGARGMHRRVNEKLAVFPRIYMSLDILTFGRQFNALFEEPAAGEDHEPDKTPPVLELFGQP